MKMLLVTFIYCELAPLSFDPTVTGCGESWTISVFVILAAV